MRLVPIESVAATIEVKLSLTRKRMLDADSAATETSRLRYRFSGSIPTSAVARRPLAYGSESTCNPTQDERNAGLALADPAFAPNRPTFAIFAFGGLKTPERLVGWLRECRTLDVVCCLGAGCVSRRSDDPGYCWVAQHDDALAMFAQWMSAAVDRHEGVTRVMHPAFSEGYAAFDSLRYWDSTGYEDPSNFKPLPEDIRKREALYASRPKLRKGSR
jgi:hypothetical protein